ncbi:MAG: hypothetical protein ABIM89_10615 [Mycobacteriales bacterium]
MSDSAPPLAGRALDRVIGWLGVALHLAVGVFPFAPSGVVLAGWPIVFVWAVWVAGLVVVVLLRGRAPRWAPVPVGCVLIWLATVAAFGAA